MNIVCVACAPWKGNYASSTVALMKMLGKKNNVLYVENPETYAVPFKSLLKGQVGRFLSKLFSKGRLETIEQNAGTAVYVLHLPPVFPHNFLPEGKVYQLFAKRAGKKIKGVIDETTGRLGMQTAIVNVTAFNPALSLAIGKLKAQEKLVYYCYDNIHAAPWLSKHGAPVETGFASLADRIVVSSSGLAEKFHAMKDKLCIVKNGADTDLFRAGLNPERQTQKTVGFIGSLDERVDYTLLKELILKNPDWNFVFAGRVVDSRAEELTKISPHVKLLGAMSLESLVPVVRSFTVGIIPFVLDEFTRTIYPLKINEYLAAGLPVISTPFADLSDFKDVIGTADSAEGFSQLMQDSLNENVATESSRRMDFAANNSWEKRSSVFTDCLNNA